ncbi:class I SAM-dependent methyltransferase [Ruegeria sp. THAF33]|uniref:class I SAM-dependent methyltransferase n=1 Tax=Ruegeria sp. THAF33 TaxID=2587853 RepID=UPI001267F427|nr:methyltransferase domain-containing protein [Ruegeria sp. THAF33]QFT73769.1 Demethylrebeccamycin-D-glucose O-methyltransferase [Ruegeria sp. THAF33]
MADPFQNVDAAGPEFIKLFADSMDQRQADPTMERIVAAYLGHLNVTDASTVVEVGAGAGAVTRRIASHCHPAKVIGFEPSKGFVSEANTRAKEYSNLTFKVADGAALPLEDDAVDAVIMHTVLTHVEDPKSLVAEAFRVLKPDGILIVCDADFSKATFNAFPNDPLDICAKEFVREFVTDPFIVAKLRSMISDAGLSMQHFDVQSRVVSTAEQMLPWVALTTKQMYERGDIGKELAEGLVAEHERRARNGSLYGYQVFATVVAAKAA